MMRKALAGRLVACQPGIEVHGEIWGRLPRTLWLAFGGIAIAAAAAVALALLTAGRRRRGAGAVAEGAALLGVSMPGFWLGAVLAYLVGVETGGLPHGGAVGVPPGPPPGAPPP